MAARREETSNPPTQLDAVTGIEHRLTPTVLHVHVDRSVLVTAEEELVPIPLSNPSFNGWFP